MPLYADVDGYPVRAVPGGPRRGSCRECGAGMLARTGAVRIWHWAHLAAAPGCVAAGESEWHLAWKALGLDGTQEVRVGRRRADVLAPGGFAVEFQDWAIDQGELWAREDDWAGQGGMVWVFRADRAYAEGRIEVEPSLARFGDDLVKPENRATVNMKWLFAPERARFARAPAFLDIGDGELLFVGAWRDERPLAGYGWRVPKQWVVDNVLRGAVIPGPLAGDPDEVRYKILTYQAAQAQAQRLERLRETARRISARMAESFRQWDEAGGMPEFEARMRKLREAEAGRAPVVCDVCGREVEAGYAAELKKKGLPPRHVLCKG